MTVKVAFGESQPRLTQSNYGMLRHSFGREYFEFSLQHFIVPALE